MKKNNSKLKSLFNLNNKNKTRSYLLVIIIYIICEVLLKTGNMSSLFTNLLVPTCCYIVAAIALNLCVGLSGELSLGHAGFMSIGAFSSMCLSGILAPIIPSPIIRLILGIVIGAICSGIFGFLIGIPVLKLEGDYLAIVTLAFCQIIVSLLNNVYFGFDDKGFQFSFIDGNLNLSEETGKILLNGPMGASGTERIANFTTGIILVLITLFIVYNLMDSKNGRAIMASRDNKIASKSVGIDVTKTKMLAFIISACLAGAAGGLYGVNFSTLAPSKFNFNQSILILVYVVLGGLGNITGTIIATIVLYLLPELLRGLADYRMIIYSVILIAIMLLTNNAKFKLKFDGFKKKFISRKESK